MVWLIRIMKMQQQLLTLVIYVCMEVSKCDDYEQFNWQLKTFLLRVS